MKHAIDAWLGDKTTTWVAAVQHRPRQVLTCLILITLAFAFAAITKLGINSNNLDLISPKLESRINHAEFSAHFPNLENALLVVVDSNDAQTSERAAKRLENRLNQLPDTIETAYRTGGGDHFERNGLLYLSTEELESLSSTLVRMKPFVSALESQPNLVNLSTQIRIGMSLSRGDSEFQSTWSPVLLQLAKASERVLGQQSNPTESSSLSFDVLPSSQQSTRQVIITHPKLEFGSVLAANRSIKAIRLAATDLGFGADSGIEVRITGNPALNLEEMIGIAWDIGVAGLFCFALVVLILTIALRSLPLVVATVSTLLVGLVWTAGLAALTIGHLNIVSLSVAILFIGLGVDFAIHLGMRYADALRAGIEERAAMQLATREVGSSLVICTISTAIAFLVFIPTPYLGVAELGLIAGSGMVVILFLTFTLFPALLATCLRFDASNHIRSELRFEANLGRWVQSNAILVRYTSLTLLCLGLFIAPNARFDPNVIDMRDPSTESVQVFNELLDESGLASPWYVDAIAPTLDRANQLASDAAQLPQIENAITLTNYVPSEQDDKLEMLRDLRTIYGEAVKHDQVQSLPNDAARHAALSELNSFLARQNGQDDKSVFAQNLRRLQASLNQLLSQPAKSPATLSALEQNLLGELPDQLKRLRTALSASRVDLAVLPSRLRERMLTDEGLARIQFFPTENLRNEAHLRDFVNSVKEFSPKVSGIAVNMLAFEDATKQSFAQALASAVLLITLLLIFLWRNVTDVLLVLAPLFLSLILAISAMALLDLPFNFVNVIVIPLMFGIGVDSGIHLVHRSHSTISSGDSLLGTTTARAVYYSALTTFISFGSLSLSGHRGMASLGTLLAIGMILTVLCNLVLLPALLEWVRPNSARQHRHATE